MFACMIPPGLSTGQPQSKAEVGKSIQSDKVPKAAQGRATPGQEAALQKPQSRPSTAQFAPGLSQTSSFCTHLPP